MPIPESQLSGWSDHGPQQASISTHETIRRALDNHRWPHEISYDFYLQGSYHNDTNLPGDSDVDVVLELDSVIRHDWSSLSQYEQGLLSSSLQPPTYGWNDFRREALKALQESFGRQAVSQGNKSIKLKGASRTLAADIVVCIKFRSQFPKTSPCTRRTGPMWMVLRFKPYRTNTGWSISQNFTMTMERRRAGVLGTGTGGRYACSKAHGTTCKQPAESGPSSLRPISWNAFSTMPQTRRIRKGSKKPIVP